MCVTSSDACRGSMVADDKNYREISGKQVLSSAVMCVCVQCNKVYGRYEMNDGAVDFRNAMALYIIFL